MTTIREPYEQGLENDTEPTGRNTDHARTVMTAAPTPTGHDAGHTKEQAVEIVLTEHMWDASDKSLCSCGWSPDNYFTVDAEDDRKYVRDVLVNAEEGDGPDVWAPVVAEFVAHQRGYLIAALSSAGLLATGQKAEIAAQRERADANEKIAEDAIDEFETAVSEVERLTSWQAEALPVLTGLQELGRALGVPLGAQITARAAVDLALDLRNQINEARAAVAVAQAAERERIRAAIRLVQPDHLTPVGARIIEQALGGDTDE